MPLDSDAIIGTARRLPLADDAIRLTFGQHDVVVRLADRWLDQLPLLVDDMTVAVVGAEWQDDGSLFVGDASLLVLEPGTLYDVTDVVAMIDESGANPTSAIIRRLMPPVFSAAAAKGTVVNTMLDLLVADPQASDEEIVRRAERHHALLLAHLHQRGEREAILAAANIAMPLIKNGIATLSTRTNPPPHLVLEPTFASPIVGLIGRIDILVRHSGDGRHCDVVELKSGSAPALSARATHRAQVVAYEMLLERVIPRRTGVSAIWYALAASNPWRDVVSTADDRTVLIKARNALVDIDRRIAQRDTSLLQQLTSMDLDALPPYMHGNARNVAADILSLRPNERVYLRAWLGFIASEQRQQRQDLGRPMWNDDVVARRQRPSALTDLKRSIGQDADPSHLRFERTRTDDDCSLRAGDIVIAYPMEEHRADPSEHQLLKASIRSINPQSVEISLRNKHIDVASIADAPLWVVEHDASENSVRDLYGNLGSFLQADTAARDRLLGTARPRMAAPVPVRATGLRDTQRDVVERALGARDWFLIQGPPGTGKTSSVIRGLTTGLLDDPRERVLLVAFTNRAADEICQVIERSLGAASYLRVGAKDTRSAARSLHALSASMDTSALCELLRSTRCVVATIASMTRNMDLLEYGRFTTVIVDEASQVLEPQLLGILSSAERFILVGDECQLPAVIMQPTDRLAVSVEAMQRIGLSTLGTSYFARLMQCAVQNGWTDVIGRLSEQGRMHGHISSIAGALFYGDRLVTMHESQTTSAPWLATTDSILAPIIEARAVCVHASGSGTNEVVVTTVLTERFLAAVDAVGADATIGIIAPFRTHINAIRQALPAAIRDRVTVDTVERYQGSERDVIIYATGVSSTSDLDALTSETTTVFGTIDRKLNVAFTRARQQFILVGDTSILRQSPHYQALLARLTPVSASTIVC